MNIQTKLNNESCTLSGELYDLWVTSQESCLNIIHQLCKLIPYSYTMRHSLIISFFNEEFRSQEKNPSLLRWISHSWQSWGWDSGFLILNSVIFCYLAYWFWSLSPIINVWLADKVQVQSYYTFKKYSISSHLKHHIYIPEEFKMRKDNFNQFLKM